MPGESCQVASRQFAPQQDEALKAVSNWLKEGRSPLFRLFGYAGTGKTTLAKHFAEHVDGDVLFAAFTGKAAQVLRSRGASNAKTIHSLIYRPRGEEEVEDEETGKTSIAPMFSRLTLLWPRSIWLMNTRPSWAASASSCWVIRLSMLRARTLLAKKSGMCR